MFAGFLSLSLLVILPLGLTACEEGTGVEEDGLATPPPTIVVWVFDEVGDDFLPVEYASVQLYRAGDGLLEVGQTNSTGFFTPSVSLTLGTYTAFAQKNMVCKAETEYYGGTSFLGIGVELDLN